VRRRDLLGLGGVALGAAAIGTSFDARRHHAEAETPKRGGIFRIRGEDPLGFDPHQGTSARTTVNLSFTHSRLLKVKAGPAVVPGTSPLEPDLAESWTQPSETTYLFKLRRGVRWHPRPPVNGRELTADDVRYTFERFTALRYIAGIDRIETLDPLTVRFTLKEPFAWFLDVLASTSAWIVPREAVEKFGDLKRAEACIGTGPWMLERHEPNVRLTFVRNPYYFVPGLPYADGVEATIEADPAARFASWLAGKYDFGPEYGMVARRLDLDLARQRKPGLQTAEFVVRFGGLLSMKLDQAPFRDLRVRRAMALARNWKEALDANAWSLGHGVPNPAIPAAFKEWSIPISELPADGRKLYEQDIPEAKRLLAEAGYPGGFATTLETTADFGPDWMDGVQLLLAQLKAVGIQPELRLKEFGAYLTTTAAGRFEHMAAGLFGFFAVPDSYLFLYYTPGLPTNGSGVNDPKLTDMIRQERRTLDATKRRDILWDIQRYCSQQAYYLYGPSVTAVSAWDRHVRNFAPNVGDDYGGRLMAAWLDR
jgi:peptide/nickel transport system substrate-binding protein